MKKLLVPIRMIVLASSFVFYVVGGQAKAASFDCDEFYCLDAFSLVSFLVRG